MIIEGAIDHAYKNHEFMSSSGVFILDQLSVAQGHNGDWYVGFGRLKTDIKFRLPPLHLFSLTDIEQSTIVLNQYEYETTLY